MSIKKGDLFKASYYPNRTYIVAGRWNRDIVLSPVDESEECELYSEGEIKELVQQGRLTQVAPESEVESR